jgi:hypothetical protein
VVFGFLDTAYFHTLRTYRSAFCTQFYYMTDIMIGVWDLLSITFGLAATEFCDRVDVI